MPHRSARLTAVAAGALISLVVAVPLATGAAKKAPGCHAGQLKLKFLGEQGATGHRFWDYALVNGGKSCSLHGYMTAVLLNAKGHVIKSGAVHPRSGFKAKTFTVAQGKRAFFTFTYVDGGFCPGKSVTASRFRFALPGASKSYGFSPVAANHGRPTVCKGSEQMFPLRAKRSPTAARDVAGHVAATPTCTAAGLRLDKVGGQGFTSHREWDFALRNVTAHTCKLKGFPTVTPLDAGAHLVADASVHHGAPGTTVVLPTWHRAFLRYVFTVAGPCLPHSFSAYGLQVTPPGGHGHLVYYAGRFDVCAASVGGHPQVSAVVSHLGP